MVTVMMSTCSGSAPSVCRVPTGQHGQGALRAPNGTWFGRGFVPRRHRASSPLTPHGGAHLQNFIDVSPASTSGNRYLAQVFIPQKIQDESSRTIRLADPISGKIWGGGLTFALIEVVLLLPLQVLPPLW